jgi:hypothetical protein
MKVPDDGWPDFADQALNADVIAGIDFEIATNNHFQLELDKEQGVYYAMRSDSIACYEDEMYCSFSLFHLPAFSLSNPADNFVEVKTAVDDNNDYITLPRARNKNTTKIRNNQQSTLI